jgi:transcriptional regulator with GAF, ATPase, and Fis domain
MSQHKHVVARAAAVPEHLLEHGPRLDEERLIGADTGLAAVMARARVVARSSAPVLVFGETGTGKEIIARAKATSPASSCGSSAAIPRLRWTALESGDIASA